MLVKAVVFDLDGTLVDSLADIAMSVNAVLERHGREPHALATYRELVGWGLAALLDSASASRPFTEQEKAVVLAELREDYRRHPVHSRPYDGVAELVDHVEARVPAAVLSNKDDAMTKQVVTRLLPGRFAELVGARAGVPHKPDPTSLLALLARLGVAPDQTVYLGDSGVDMETATRAGAFACGAAWGFRPREELVEAGARVVFDSPDSFREWLETRAVLG